MKPINKIFKILDSKSRDKIFADGLENFHLWDAESQGDMCVRINHRLSVRGEEINVINVIEDFKKIVED